MFTRYFFYLVRWQISTPILAICIIIFARFGNIWATIIANFIGGLMFFWIDLFIFTKKAIEPLWGIKKDTICNDCGKKVKRGYRLIYTKNYNKTKDENPKFRCEACSEKKFDELIKNGVVLQ
jgi:hypothetical protein